MNESKISATERLRSEGRWDKASLFRDDERKRLRGEGMTRQAANEESWRLMLAKFSPIAPTSDLEYLQTPDAETEATFAEADDARLGDVVGDVLWVYSKLAVKSVSPADCSAGRWAMLQWARANAGRFYEQLLPKAMAGKFGECETKQNVETEDDFSELERLCRAAVANKPVLCSQCGCETRSASVPMFNNR